jgi:hypothetical protein
MATRPRHPDKDLEAVLRDAEARLWHVTRDKRYYIMRCSCHEKHQKTVKLTPSGSRYELNLRKWLERQSCWRKEEGR